MSGEAAQKRAKDRESGTPGEGDVCRPCHSRGVCVFHLPSSGLSPDSLPRALKGEGQISPESELDFAPASITSVHLTPICPKLHSRLPIAPSLPILAVLRDTVQHSSPALDLIVPRPCEFWSTHQHKSPLSLLLDFSLIMEEKIVTSEQTVWPSDSFILYFLSPCNVAVSPSELENLTLFIWTEVE